MTQLQLCNLALGKLANLPITNLASTTDASAIALNREWEAALEEFLSEAPWNWAKTRDTLTESSPAPTFGWTSRFALPSDFVTLIGLNEIYSDTPSDLWEIEGGYIYTDETAGSDPATIDVEYIRKPSASELDTFLDTFDPKAVTAFTTLLAAKVAPAIAQDGLTKAQQLLQQYYGLDLVKARFRNSQVNRMPPRFPYQTSTNLRARSTFTNG